MTVIKKNEPLEQMLSYTVEIMPRSFDLYIGRMGGPSSEFSVAEKERERESEEGEGGERRTL